MMNKWIGMGRTTRKPELRYSQGAQPVAIARWTLAVDRRKTKENEDPGADFISCIAFGRNAEFAEKYLDKGTKVLIMGHIQTGSYENQDGQRVYTTDVVVETLEFAESKKGMSEADRNARDEAVMQGYGGEGFMNVPDGLDEELPFQ